MALTGVAHPSSLSWRNTNDRSSIIGEGGTPPLTLTIILLLVPLFGGGGGGHCKKVGEARSGPGRQGRLSLASPEA